MIHRVNYKVLAEFSKERSASMLKTKQAMTFNINKFCNEYQACNTSSSISNFCVIISKPQDIWQKCTEYKIRISLFFSTPSSHSDKHSANFKSKCLQKSTTIFKLKARYFLSSFNTKHWDSCFRLWRAWLVLWGVRFEYWPRHPLSQNVFCYSSVLWGKGQESNLSKHQDSSHSAELKTCYLYHSTALHWRHMSKPGVHKFSKNL
jgi:hypothetical protein